MKNEYKLIIFICVLSLSFMCLSTICLYDSKLSAYYVYQVGIYNEEENKDEKLKELKKDKIEGYCYKNKDSYYVLSMISNDLNEVKEHQKQMKGIIKTYHFKEGLSDKEVLKCIEGSINND